METKALRALIEVGQHAGLWGTSYLITPLLLDEVFGDGANLMWLEPIDHRPNYYVFQADSRWDDNNWTDHERKGTVAPRDWLGEVYRAIESQFGDGFEHYDDEGEELDEPEWIGWPGCNFESGCSWGFLDWPEAREDLADDDGMALRRSA